MLEQADAQGWRQRPEVEQQTRAAAEQIVFRDYMLSVSQVPADYPSAADEQRILVETTSSGDWKVERVLAAKTILDFQRLVRQVPISPHVAHYATELIRATRPGPGADEWVRTHVRWGAGTRAGQALLLAAKAGAVLAGRTAVSCADVRALALPVLRHRISCTFAAAAEGIDADAVVTRIAAMVKEPAY